jgi:hypothetical protein
MSCLSSGFNTSPGGGYDYEHLAVSCIEVEPSFNDLLGDCLEENPNVQPRLGCLRT